MFRSIRSLAIIVIITFTAVAAHARGPTRHIVGGDRIKPGEYTMVVALVFEPGRTIHCSGTVVGDRWLLTAAHCLNDGTPKVIPGRDLRPSQSPKAFQVAETFRYPSPETDVALLKLFDPVVSSSVAKVTLSQTDPAIGDVLTVAGWGYVDWAMTAFPIRPKKVAVEVAQFCSAHLICSIPVKNREGPNYGDSGGPCFLGSSTTVIVGIIKGGDTNYPGTALCEKASSIRAWVQSTMASH